MEKLKIYSIEGIALAAKSHEKLLRVKLELKLKFENHIT